MLNSLQAPLLFGLTAAFITTLGLITVSLRGDWSARHSGLFALAAGGMLVSLTLLHIAPEAFELSTRTPIFLMIGFFGGLILHFGIGAAFPESSDRGQAAAITPLAAVAIHSLLDGMIYSVTFAASFSSGVYAAASLMLHEFPEGVIAFAILRRHSFSNRSAFFWAFLAAAVTTPLGVLVATPFMHGLTTEVIGSLFAVSAGLLLYVATGPLMEPLGEEPPGRSFLALGAGVLLAVLMALVPLHSHAHGDLDDHGHDHGPTPRFGEIYQPPAANPHTADL
ncbi:ZIP family metal transporter [uncultured Hyphomonas sp.]|uniref:ZIP family metal transporter n=1 Tax=uncultured Hyphomonas sp. TaxID=225298 RepID=UPI002AAB866C|nr:ZIP family metal transporter [uncultured Hyphomonas sp.]